MTSQADYLGRARTIAWEVAEHVPPSVRLEQANRLIEHSEPAEGLGYLAWAIVESETTVPAQLIQAIRAESSGLCDGSELPTNLDEFSD